MTFSPRRSVLLLAVLPVLALTACGSDDGGTGDGTATTASTAAATTTAGGAATTAAAGAALDGATLAARANAICKATNDQGNALPPIPANADNDHRAEYYAKLAALTAGQQAGLEALTPAADVKAQWEAFVALTKEATDLVQAIPPAIRVDAGGKSQSLAERVNALSPKINAAADALGARICGSDSGKA